MVREPEQSGHTVGELVSCSGDSQRGSRARWKMPGLFLEGLFGCCRLRRRVWEFGPRPELRWDPENEGGADSRGDSEGLSVLRREIKDDIKIFLYSNLVR